MSAQSDLLQAIEWMQDGAIERGADLLNRLVDSDKLDSKGRAAAYVWLGEAREDSGFKIRCLRRALELDPENQQIRQGLRQLLAARPQPGRMPAMRAAPADAVAEDGPAVVGVLGGMNGLASGVFIDSAGWVATTSYAIGGAASVSIMLEGEDPLPGTVIRRLPTHDLALITTALKLARKPAMTPPSMIRDDEPFVALGYGGQKLRGALRPAGGARDRRWLRTTIPPAHLTDAGGNPLYDEKGQLLGLLTRNVEGAGDALAIPMAQVAALAEGERRDRQLMPQSRFCRQCGGQARAWLYGGRHCETCGAALATEGTAAPPAQRDKLMALYREDAARPCVNCGARLGQYGGRCLRCGAAAGM